MPLTLSLYLSLLVLVGAERLAELFLSRRNARIQLARGAVEVGAAHFRVMALVHAIFLPACFAEAFFLHRSPPGPLAIVALFAVLLAQALRWWAVATLGPRWNVRVIAIPGAPAIATGPYKIIRHPNYLAVAIELLSLPLVHGAWICALVFTLANAALMAVRIPAEERALGELYATQFASTPRLWPGSSRGPGVANGR
jgi:methyltransferase